MSFTDYGRETDFPLQQHDTIEAIKMEAEV